MIALSEKKKKSMIGKWVEKHKVPVYDLQVPEQPADSE